MSDLRTADDHAAWLAWRAAGVTATEVADAYAGTYGGLYGVVARKLGLQTVETNPAMQRGHRWQPMIADAVHAITRRYVVGEETQVESARNPLYRATVDGFLAWTAEATLDDVDAVLEIKTRGVRAKPDRDRWRAQIQWQLGATGLDRGLLADAVIDDDVDELVALRLEWQYHDAGFLAELEEVADEILVHVDERRLPTPDNGTALDAVKAVHAVADPAAGTVDLDDIAADLDRLAELRAEAKQVDTERRALEAIVLDRIGPATAGTGGVWSVTVSKPRATVDKAAAAELLAARPELGRLELDLDLVREHAADELDGIRKPGARTLTIRPRKADQ